VASTEARDVLDWAMHPALHRLIHMAIECIRLSTTPPPSFDKLLLKDHGMVNLN
jgi:hypothetical protein